MRAVSLCCMCCQYPDFWAAKSKQLRAVSDATKVAEYDTKLEARNQTWDHLLQELEQKEKEEQASR